MAGPKPAVLPITPRGSDSAQTLNVSNLSTVAKEELFCDAAVRMQAFLAICRSDQ